MIKRILCVFMCCFVIAALSLSVFAADLPDNDVIGGVNLKSMAFRYYDAFTEDYTSTIISLNRYFPFGEVTMIGVQYAADALDSSYPDKIYVSLVFDIILNDEATIYLPVDASRTWESYNFGSLNSYRSSYGDITVNLAPKSLLYGARLVTSSGSSTVLQFEDAVSSDEPFVDVDEVKFLCFRNVPKGSYTVSIQTPDNESGVIYNQTRFYVAPFVSIPTVYDDVANGFVSPVDAIDSINANLDSILDSNVSIAEKQLAVSVATHDIQRIWDSSFQPFINMASTVNLEAIKTEYFNATSLYYLDYFHAYALASITNIDIPSTLNAEQTAALSSFLDFCVTTLNSYYEVKKSNLEGEVITDSDLYVDDEKLTDLDDKYSIEEELLNKFDPDQFNESINYTDWFSTLRSDYLVLKSIYNWFFDITQSFSLANFLIIPFFLVITSILLGTSMSVIARRDK